MAIKIGFDRNKSMCYRKKKFSLASAEIYAEHYKQRIYECPVCGSYHLTSNTGEPNAE